MAKKVYAIKEGYDSKNNTKVEDIIVGTWSECLNYVKGVKGAKYKSFESLEEAKNFLKETKKLLKKGEDEYPMNQLHAYVDGSYNIATERYGYGLVVVKNSIITYIENGAAEDDSQKQIRQIAGELKGAIRAVKYAAYYKQSKIVIFHDYEGICHHATGYWKRTDESSERYYNEFNKLIDTYGIEVTFVKVDSHTGDFFNEVADEQAKLPIGVENNKVVLNYLKNNKVKVLTEEVKEKLLKTAQGMDENIEVIKEKNSINKGKESKNSKEKVEKELDIEEIINKIKSMDMNKAKEYIEGLEEKEKTNIILKLIK